MIDGKSEVTLTEGGSQGHPTRYQDPTGSSQLSRRLQNQGKLKIVVLFIHPLTPIQAQDGWERTQSVVLAPGPDSQNNTPTPIPNHHPPSLLGHRGVAQNTPIWASASAGLMDA